MNQRRTLIFLLLFSVALFANLAIDVTLSLAQNYSFHQMIPKGGDDRLKKAQAVAISSDSTYYIADQDARMIYQYGADGKPADLISSVTVADQPVTFDEISSLYIDRMDNLYIADRGKEHIVVIGADGTNRIIGESGGGLGNLDDLGSIAVDSEGYLYAVSADEQQIVVFDNNGRYVTWIRGTTRNFDDIVAIGVNKQNELYVLEESGPSVQILTPAGEMKRHIRAVNRNPSISIEDPRSLAVFENGDFFILDGDKGNITHFNSDGSVKGTLGSKGASAKGIFKKAVAIASSPVHKNTLLILDRDSRLAQQFSVPNIADTARAFASNRIEVRDVDFQLPKFHTATSAPDGTIFVISDDRKKVAAYTDLKAEPKYTLNADEAEDLAVDLNNNLYVLDKGSEQVAMYDDEGVLIRKFGKEISEGLREPTGIAALSDGSIVVSDLKNGDIKLWNAQGVYQKRIISNSSGTIEDPYKLRSDSQDNIYVWDRGKNWIIKIDRDGNKTGDGYLRLRTKEAGEMGGEIFGLQIDPLDQLHMFNQSTNQYEVVAWQEYPKVIFRYGKTGDGPNAFDRVEGMALIEKLFTAYILNDKGREVKVFQLSIRPPAPNDDYAFENEEEKLTISVTPSDFPALTYYSLVRINPNTGQDTVIAKKEEPIFEIPVPEKRSISALKYAIFSETQTDRSKLTTPFTDYFGQANAHFAQKQYDDALNSYYDALSAMDRPEGMVTFIAKRYANLAITKADAYELEPALLYARAAHKLDSSLKVTHQALGAVFQADLNTLANNRDYELMQERADRYLNESVPGTSDRIINTLDSVATSLLESGTLTDLQTSGKLFGSLLTIDSERLQFSFGQAQVAFSTYQLKKSQGAPGFEQAVFLDEAMKSSKSTLDKLPESDTGALSHRIRLHHAEVLAEKNEMEAVIALTSDQLKNEGVSLDKEMVLAYRQKLADAYLATEQVEAAVLEYQKILSEDPENGKYNRQLAEALIQNESYDDAKLIYQKLLFKDRENPELIKQIGKVELLKGNFAEASFQLEKAVKMDPNMVDAYQLLAEAYDGASNFQKAIENYKIALTQKEKALERAREQFISGEQTEQLQSDITDIVSNMARLYSQMGQYDTAIDNYERLTKLQASSSAAWQGLGAAYLSSGLVYDAIKAFNTALKLEPTSEAISSELSKARSMRDEISKNKPPVEFIEIRTRELYPSLYRNYDDPSSQPIGEVILANNTNLPINGVELSLFIEGIMSAPTEQKMKPLVGFSNTEIALSAVFEKEILNNTQDKTYQATLSLTYRSGGEEKTVEKTAPFLIRGRNAITWKDKRRLAAFVAPNNEEIINYVKKLDVLFGSKPTYGVNENILKAAQIYSALTQSNFAYSPDPENSFALVTTNTDILDFLQYPTETLQRKSGDCDDLVTVMCSLLENSGISTAYIDVPGHVFMAFDTGIDPTRLDASGLTEEDVIIKYEKTWVPIETTLLGSEDFTTSWKSAVERYRKEQEEGNFPELVTLSDAREIYAPSSFTPEPFEPGGTDSLAVMKAYDGQLQKIYKKTTAEIKRELEFRRENEPNNIYVRNTLAVLYARSGNLEGAEECISEALEIHPRSSTLLNNLGNVQYRQQKYEEALASYESAFSNDESDPEILINITKTHIALGQMDKAYERFTQAVNLDSDLSELYSYLNDMINQ